MTDNELNVTATCITALASQPNAQEKITLLLKSLFENYKKEGYQEEQETQEIKSVSVPLIFTQKELSKMPKEFSKHFKVGKLTAHVRQKKNGVYEIYCQTNNNIIRSYGKLLSVARADFIVKIDAYSKGNYKPTTAKKKGTNFIKYMELQIEEMKKFQYQL